MYCDVIFGGGGDGGDGGGGGGGGAACTGTVVTVGPLGQATLTVPAMSAAAIHVGAKLGASP